MILIDHRAGSRDLIRHEPLTTLAELAKFETLGYPGDVVFYGNGPDDAQVQVGIEVKKLHDFYSSTDTGRMTGAGKGQLPVMIDYGFDVIYVIYYGTYRASSRGGNSPKVRYLNTRGNWSTMKLGKRPCYFNGLTSVTTEFQLLNIIVHRLNDIREVALAIGTLYRWWQKPWDNHTLFHQFNTVSDIGGKSLMPNIPSDVLQRAKVASSLLQDFSRAQGKRGRGRITGGMGYKKSIQLARHFDSVLDMIDTLATDPTYVARISWTVKSKTKTTGEVRERRMTIGPVIADALQRAVLAGFSDERALMAKYKCMARQTNKTKK